MMTIDEQVAEVLAANTPCDVRVITYRGFKIAPSLVTTISRTLHIVFNDEDVIVVGDPSPGKKPDVAVGPISEFKKIKNNTFFRMTKSGYSREEIKGASERRITKSFDLWHACFEGNYNDDIKGKVQFLNIIGAKKGQPTSFDVIREKAEQVANVREENRAAIEAQVIVDRYGSNPNYGVF